MDERVIKGIVDISPINLPSFTSNYAELNNSPLTNDNLSKCRYQRRFRGEPNLRSFEGAFPDTRHCKSVISLFLGCAETRTLFANEHLFVQIVFIIGIIVFMISPHMRIYPMDRYESLACIQQAIQFIK